MLTILILLIYAALVFFTIKAKQTFTPAGVMVFLWTTLNAMLLLFFRDWVELTYVGLFYIAAGVTAFFVGSIIAIKTAKNTANNPNYSFNNKIAVIILCATIALGFVNPIYSIYANGFSLSNLFDIEDLSNMTKEFSTIRYYKEDETYSKIAQLFLIFTYTAPIIAGFVWLFFKRGWQKALCIVALLPCIFITFSQSTKMSTIVSLMFFFAGIVVASISYGIKIKITPKYIIIVSCLSALVLAGLFYSMLTRWDENITDDKVEHNKTTFFNYTFGSPICFDHWLYNDNQGLDYSTYLLQNCILIRWGYFKKVENGIRVDFNPSISKKFINISGRYVDDFKYDTLNNYTIQFDLQCNVKPDSVKISLYSFNSNPQGHYLIAMDKEEQIAPDKWHYSHTFSLDHPRSVVRTPNIILSLKDASFFEITKFRLDTGTVAHPWVNGSGNMFYRDNSLKYGVMTFFGIFNGIGLAKRQTGIYRDFIYFGRLDKTMRSNVYTIFRMLIDDFGKIGALVFLVLLGFASSKAIIFIQKRKMVFLSQTFLVAVYSYVMWGFVASIWAYTSILCAFGLSFFIFSILQKPLQGDTWVTKITKKLKAKQK